MGKVSLDYITIMCEVILICLSLFRANNLTDLLDHFPRPNQRSNLEERLERTNISTSIPECPVRETIDTKDKMSDDEINIFRFA